jgi:hypothetical protein
MPTLEDLAALGWETVARILWIRRDSDAATRTGAILRFRRDAIRCMHCSSSSSLINYNYCCGHIASGDTELTGVSMTSGSASPFSGTTGTDLLVELKQIQCLICLWTPFQSSILTCDSCLFTYHYSNNPTVRVTLYHKIKTMAEEMFGDEIKDLQAEPATVADKTNYFDTSRGPGKHEIA